MWRIIILLILVSNFVSAQKDITNSQIWAQELFNPKGIDALNFLKDGAHYTVLKDNSIIEVNLVSGNRTKVVFNASKFAGEKDFSGILDHYEFSDDESRILLRSETEKIYRRSTKAKFYVLDRESEELIQIHNGKKVMNAHMNPQSNKLAYVSDNNLYIQDLASGQITRVTDDGEKNKIINGAADWVYEEEFKLVRAFEWNATGDQLAFIKFDENEVKEFILTKHNNDAYPEYIKFKYPKVGEKNSIVSLHLFDLKSKSLTNADLGNLEEMYIPRIKWTKDSNRLCVFVLNRHQNHLKLLLVDSQLNSSEVLLEEKNKYYISITDDFNFLEDGKHFILTSEKDGYNHIYLYDINGNQISDLTEGPYDVTKFYGVDEKNRTVYFQAAVESPLQKQVYKVNYKAKTFDLISPATGTNIAQFSGNFDYFVNQRSTINTPPVYEVYTNNGAMVRQIEENKNVVALQEKYGAVTIDFFDFTTSENVNLNGWMMKPVDFNPNRKYPVLMYVYGGPGSQQVTDSWKGQNYWWFQLLAQEGYIVACVDNRGTGARGEEFKKMTYLQLGRLETKDQIEAATYLSSLDYIDGGRIGIFGWSYGGYMSSLCILKGGHVFKTAIAVAPVTNWKWYDTVYTERYMRTDDENPAGYAQNSPVNFTQLLRGNYLLVHGFADDNVHFQHTAEIANALIRDNKQFDTYFYPNRAHSIRAEDARVHLFTKMTNFIKEKL